FLFVVSAISVIYTLSLHDALPIYDWFMRGRGDESAVRVLDCEFWSVGSGLWVLDCGFWTVGSGLWVLDCGSRGGDVRQLGEVRRSEEHTSELQSRENLVCRLLLEK